MCKLSDKFKKFYKTKNSKEISYLDIRKDINKYIIKNNLIKEDNVVIDEHLSNSFGLKINSQFTPLKI